MQTLRKKVRFTYEDYLNFPPEKRYEIIEGDLHMTPAPLTKHQMTLLNLTLKLHEFINKNSLGKCLIAPVDVVLSREDVIQPDILFISKDRLGILTEKNVEGPPDLLVEVLSPSTKNWDREAKRKLYEHYGVREYWIVDPDAKTVEVLQMTDDGYRSYRVFACGTHLQSPLLEGLAFLIDEIF